MAKVDLKSKTVAELHREMVEAHEELRKLRFKVAGTTGLKNSAGALRKTVARIKTELKNRDK